MKDLAFLGFSMMSTPLIIASPEVEEMYPVIMFMVVDFPAPLGPRKPRISPSFTSNEILLTAFLSP